MILRIFRSIIYNKVFAKLFLKTILNIHTRSYKMSGILASILNNGVHPKHKIMKYEEWFSSHIENDWIVLDVGCNSGIMAEVMSQKAAFVYGIDIEAKHIEKAKLLRQKSNIKYICADATKYDFSQCRGINVITLSNVLEHIEERVLFLRSLIDQIKWQTEKRLLIRVPMIDREWIVIYKRDLGLDYRLDDTHFIEYTFKKFEKELEQSGITIEKYHIQFGEIYAFCTSK